VNKGAFFRGGSSGVSGQQQGCVGAAAEVCRGSSRGVSGQQQACVGAAAGVCRGNSSGVSAQQQGCVGFQMQTSFFSNSSEDCIRNRTFFVFSSGTYCNLQGELCATGKMLFPERKKNRGVLGGTE
jgi:hypothetical protein